MNKLKIFISLLLWYGFILFLALLLESQSILSLGPMLHITYVVNKEQKK